MNKKAEPSLDHSKFSHIYPKQLREVFLSGLMVRDIWGPI